MSYWEQKRIMELRKKMAGRPYVEIPVEVIELEKSIKRLRGELAALRLREAPEVELSLRASEITPLEYRYRQLLISLKLEK